MGSDLSRSVYAVDHRGRRTSDQGEGEAEGGALKRALPALVGRGWGRGTGALQQPGGTHGEHLSGRAARGGQGRRGLPGYPTRRSAPARPVGGSVEDGLRLAHPVLVDVDGSPAARAAEVSQPDDSPRRAPGAVPEDRRRAVRHERALEYAHGLPAREAPHIPFEEPRVRDSIHADCLPRRSFGHAAARSLASSPSRTWSPSWRSLGSTKETTVL
jgi:hypothetical protein